MDSVDGPLQGLVVLDLSTNLASAYTTLLFADYGAEVIQVERPGGSPLRGMAAWPFWLRGKKSVVLDLHNSDDVEVAREIAAGSDVVVEAFGPGVADRLVSRLISSFTLRSERATLTYDAVYWNGADW